MKGTVNPVCVFGVEDCEMSVEEELMEAERELDGLDREEYMNNLPA